MSSSVFKVYSSSSRDGFENDAGSSGAKEADLNDAAAVHEDLKIDSNLVILVNKDGTVSVDQNTLQSLLANETTDTSVSVVRITSPTPSIQNEIEEEQRRWKEAKQQMDAGVGDAGSSNEDSSEESNSIAGTSSGASSVTGVATRRGRAPPRKGAGPPMEDSDDPRHVSLTVEAYYPPEEASSFAAQVLSLTGYQHPLRKETVDIDYLKHTVMNDHCYTPLTSPTQKLPPRAPFDGSEIDSAEESASATSSRPKVITLSHPSSKIIDRRKTLGVKLNKTLPTSMARSVTGDVEKGRKSVAGPEPPRQRANRATRITASPDPLDLDDVEDEDDDEVDFDYSEEEETSFSEEDDDEMDADFRVSGTPSARRRKQPTKSKVSPKTPSRSQFRKLDMKELTEREAMKEAGKHKLVKVVGSKPSAPGGKLSWQQQAAGKIAGQTGPKLVKRDVSNPRSTIGPTPTSAGLSTPTASNNKLHGSLPIVSKAHSKPESVQTKATPTTSSISSTPTTPTTNVVVPVIKKEKKPKSNAHDTALLNDMSALFSTPDIIKKVNSSKATTPTTPTTPATPIVGPSAIPVGVTPVTSAPPPAIVKQTSVNTSVALVEEKPTPPPPSPPPAPVPVSLAPVPITQSSPAAEQRLDLINAIVQEELRQPNVTLPAGEPAISSSQLSSQPMEIPNIVQMLETSVSAVDGTGSLMNAMLPEIKPMEHVHTAPPPVDLLPDTSILEALNSNEDALPEDLLEHVAELAKNKELQEILDKQVLGVIGTGPLLGQSAMPMTSMLTNLMPEQQTQVMQQPTASVTTFPMQNVPVYTEPAGKPEPPVVPNPATDAPPPAAKEQSMARKEAILVRRSDGRVITLPPIEAPATRASKRRAQGGTPTARASAGQSPGVPGGVEPVAGALPVEVAPPPQAPKPTRLSKGSVQTPSSSRPATPGHPVDESGPTELVIDEAKGKRAISKVRQSVDSRAKRASTTSVAIAVEAAQDDDLESDESWNSEDDPDRLWCICRQPHNNRFMICCDSCEDWFHGKCVNITKAMGQQMEQDGIEWTCPNCLKKKQDRQQPKMTEFLVATSAEGSKTGKAPTIAKPAPGTRTITATAPSEKETNCIVCSKPAKPSSIYCSDDCIRKHASNTVASAGQVLPTAKVDKPKERPPASPSVSSPVVLKDNNVVILMERKTGRCITGKNAPSLENLKAWLEAHPTFELVPPGSVQASIIIAKQAEVRKAQLANEAAEKKAAAGTGTPGQTPASSTSAANTSGSQSPKVQTQLKLNEQKKLVISSHAASPTLSASKTAGTSPKHATPKVFSPAASALGVKGTATPSTATSKVVSSSPSLQKGVAGTSSATVPSPATPANTSASSKQKKQTTPTSSASTEPARQSQGTKTATTPGGENIRVTVKKTLKEHLMQRTSELKEDSPITRLTEEEIDQFVSNTERELFYLFNKDTGMKYRAKYRSLVFNIKDRKNLSLFQKISEKSIEPKQLVRMTAEELASQELAQWRENETKHQLEMIKKSELDLLACAKNYVLKTHKGEEVIEGKTDDRVQLDPSAPVEDVVSLLNNSAVSSTSELDDSSSGMKDSLYRSKDYDYGGYGKLYSGVYGSGSISSSSSNIPAASGGSKSEGHVSGAGASSSSSSRKKESRRSSRSRSRSRGRKHERDRSRDRSRSKHKRKRSRDRSHDRHPSRDRDRERERDRERDRERERERDRDRHHRGRERSKERSKHDRKGSREKDGSKASSEKHRSSIGTTRGTDGADPVAKTTAETERKEDKNEAQSKLVGTLKKRTADATGKVIAEEPKTSPVVAADGKMTEAKTVVKETQDKERNISETVMAKDSDVKSIKSIDTATMPPATSSAEGKESSQESKADQDQEPTSTVTIPTPPHYPYEEEPLSEGTVPVIDERQLEAEKEHWKGSVHMVDVASVEMSIRSVSGEVHDVTKDFTEDLNICGTIKPEIVWEYIGQIKKSPNKEVCLVRFHSMESSAYYTLYNHLHSRKRYSVVKTPSPAIKDFYIFPLPAEQMIPMILKPVRGIGIVEGDRKPNLLLGILVKIRGGKRGPPSNATSAQPQLKVARRQSKHSMSTMGSKVSGSTSASSTDSLLQQVITKYATKSSGVSPSGSAVKEGSSELADAQHSEKVKDVVAMEPGAEKGTRKSQAKDTMDMDLDMNIIKAPIAGKASNMSSTLAMSGDGNSNSSSTSATARASMVESSAMLIDEDDDAPYSPGGGSDDSNFADVTAIVDTSKMQARGTARADPTLASESDQIQLAMDELNRKIAEQKNEIVGLMSMADLKEDEINSTIPPSLIQDIPIPSNLSEILASIKGGSSGGSGVMSGAIGSESLAAPSVSGMGMIITEASSAVVNDADTDANLDDEYNPTAPSIFASYKAASIPYPAIPVANSQGDIDERILPATMLPAAPAPTVVASFDMASAIATQTGLVTGLSGTLAANVSSVAPPAGASGESRLAKLSEEELLSMVPDDAILPDSSSKDP